MTRFSPKKYTFIEEKILRVKFDFNLDTCKNSGKRECVGISIMRPSRYNHKQAFNEAPLSSRHLVANARVATTKPNSCFINQLKNPFFFKKI